MKNKFLISITLLFLSVALISAFQINNEINYYNALSEKTIDDCQTKKDDEFCMDMLERETPNNDAYTTFFNMANRTVFTYLQITMPLLIVLIALNEFQKKLNTQYYKLMIQRQTYKKFIKKQISGSYKYCFVLPIILILMFLMSLAITKSLDVSLTLKTNPSYSYITSEFLTTPFLFLIFYIFNLGLNTIYYINLGLICAKKSKNIIITAIEAFLLYNCIGILMLTLGNFILSKILQIEGISYYLLLGINWSYESVTVLGILLNTLVYVILSAIIVKIKYRHKESVVIETEK